MGIRSICIMMALLTISNCYFTDDEHKNHFGSLINDFTEHFKERFDVISLSELDWHSKMELAFNHWVTAIKIRGIKRAELKYDLEINGFVLSAPVLTLELVIEDKYTVPFKITDFEFTVLLYTDKDNFRCTGTQIEYEDISLDVNAVVEYLTKQFLSLDLIKEGIKKAEIPLRNLIGRAFRDNWEKIKPLIQSIKSTRVDTKDWLKQALNEVNGIQAREDEFVLNTRTLFQLESVRVAKHEDDL